MPRPMTAAECADFEDRARAFCSLRTEYRDRKAANKLTEEIEGRLLRALNELDRRLEGMKCRDELARERMRRLETTAGDAEAERWRRAR